jgi:hypothetical protein
MAEEKSPLFNKHVTVFGGSRLGALDAYREVCARITAERLQMAFEVGVLLASKGAILVNGAGNSGLMHASIEGARSKGGRVKVGSVGARCKVPRASSRSVSWSAMSCMSRRLQARPSRISRE